jgi:hypothetical protein
MGIWTRPTSASLYPHQWLWDTFFHAIGQRHYDIERAKDETRSPFRAQWKNGMVPHVIFGEAKDGDLYHAGPDFWHCERSPNAPDHIETTGITQPPMAAESVMRIGELLSKAERKIWYGEMYPKLLVWHQWFYRERNPRGDGLPIIVLSWETGMDNTPPWIVTMHKQALTLYAKVVKQAKLDTFLEYFRKDTRTVPASERIATNDLYAVYGLVKNLRKYRYDNSKVMFKHPLRIVDITFSCILIRANILLKQIADELGEELPHDIKHAIKVAPHSLETLWDEESGQYYNRDDISGLPIKIPSVSTLMPLYSGVLPAERVDRLLALMHDPATYGAKYPIPTAPMNSPYFNPKRYWQGPTWVNVNWLLIDGLKRNGRETEAETLSRSTVAMVKKSGFHEYYSPLDATKAGAPDFSWTAALIIDLLS